jgi:hypothetical protein
MPVCTLTADSCFRLLGGMYSRVKRYLRSAHNVFVYSLEDFRKVPRYGSHREWGIIYMTYELREN